MASYRDLRAAGLCTSCARPSDAARCPECAGRLYAARAAVEGSYGRPPAHLTEVGAALGVTRERARQLQEQALRKFTLRMERLGFSADEALRGLALLGCMHGERA